MSVLRSWSGRQERKDLGRLEKKLYDIFYNAVKLSQLLRQQRASWSISFPGTKRFDSRYVKEEWERDHARNLSKQLVEIVIIPALNKCGNVDEGGFERELTVVEASVLLHLED
jgi:hypothetical protein